MMKLLPKENLGPGYKGKADTSLMVCEHCGDNYQVELPAPEVDICSRCAAGIAAENQNGLVTCRSFKSRDEMIELYMLLVEQRSLAGQGERIAIYMIGSKEEFEDSEFKGWKNSVICHNNDAEDYAICRWPIVIKVKKTVSNATLKKHLIDFIEVIDYEENQLKYNGN